MQNKDDRKTFNSFDLPPKYPFDEYSKKSHIQVNVKMNLTKKNLRRYFDENDDFLFDWLDLQVDGFLIPLKEC